MLAQQKSNCEQFAQETHYKSATVGELLLLLFKKEHVSDSHVIGANCTQKTSDFICMFFPSFMPKSKAFPSLFAHLLFLKERLERLAVTLSPLQKRDHEQFTEVAYAN